MTNILSNIADNPGATHNSKRVGRGVGSGKGKTAGSGHKGQKARSGVAINAFEGGQMPLYRRLPKRGFTNIFRKVYSVLNVSDLQKAVDAKKISEKDTITEKTLLESGVLSRLKDGVKILGDGEIKAKLKLQVSKVSKSAEEKIKSAGGAVEVAVDAKPEATA